MIFTQAVFVFFIIALLLTCRFIRNNEHRKSVLLLASYYFYAYWDWRFLFLLFGCSTFNYFCASMVARSKN